MIFIEDEEPRSILTGFQKACLLIIIGLLIVSLVILIVGFVAKAKSGFEESQETEPLIFEEGEVTEPEPTEMVSTEPLEPTCETVEATEPAETVPEVDPESLELLACVIYAEVGGDGSCDDCRRMVADVVLNRVESDLFPDTIYEVLTQPGQYGAFSPYGVYWPSRASNPNEAEAVERAYRIAREVLEGQHSELYGKGYVFQSAAKQGNDGFYYHDNYWGRYLSAEDMED